MAQQSFNDYVERAQQSSFAKDLPQVGFFSLKMMVMRLLYVFFLMIRKILMYLQHILLPLMASIEE